jgi:hypothetical protein
MSSVLVNCWRIVLQKKKGQSINILVHEKQNVVCDIREKLKFDNKCKYRSKKIMSILQLSPENSCTVNY